jgi:hypothetical protein
MTLSFFLNPNLTLPNTLLHHQSTRLLTLFSPTATKTIMGKIVRLSGRVSEQVPNNQNSFAIAKQFLNPPIHHYTHTLTEE